MISPELLRRYPFFGSLSQAQLDALAMIGEEIQLMDNQMVLVEGKPAQALFFLLEGGVDLYYTVKEESQQQECKDVLVGQINVGEPFGVSALIQPNILTSTVRSNGTSRAIQFEVKALQGALKADPALELGLVRAAARAAMQRLDATYAQLAAAWA